jgi:Carbamoyl-phosphate synthase L chain, ATP binding domain
MEPKPRILFLLLTDNEGTNLPVAGMARLGCDCAVLSPPGFTCALSRFVGHHFRLPDHRGMWLGMLSVRTSLERTMREWQPDLVVPLDGVGASLLCGLAAGRFVSVELRRVLESSLGSPAGYGAVCSRALLLDVATRIGVRAPRSRAVEMTTALEAAAAIGYPVVLKLEQTCGGCGVQIARDPVQLRDAIVAAGYARWGSRMRCRAAARRLVWRLAGLRKTKTPFELQQYISGVGAMHAVAAWQGRVLAGVSFEKLCVNPQPFGPCTVLHVIEHPEMEVTARQLVAALGYSGFAHFDFVIEKDSGHAFVIEMNAHPPGEVHLGQLVGTDVCGAMVRQLGGLTETREAAIPRDQRPIVRFPRELRRDPESPWLRAGSEVFHDVPWDDPVVFEIYYRQLLTRHPEHASKIARLLGLEDDAAETSAGTWPNGRSTID